MFCRAASAFVEKLLSSLASKEKLRTEQSEKCRINYLNTSKELRKLLIFSSYNNDSAEFLYTEIDANYYLSPVKN